MAEILPRDLNPAASVNPASAIIVDDGNVVEKGTPLQVIDAAIPLASQSEAEAGEDNAKRMTPLRVKQAIDALGFSEVALGASTGSEMVGFGDSFGSGTVADRINILSATARPAMAGIFSSGDDQRLALLDFINEAAAGGKTIEWGPIDLSLDASANQGDPSTRGLTVPSGSRWVMHPETIFRALPTASTHYEIINIWDKQDIVIEGNGARLIGERDDHTGSTGEWGHGLSIRGSTNIRVSDLIAEDCWGDGFYIGVSDTQNHCRDIYLKNTKAIRARRNGMSLISARGFLSEDHESTDTNGTAPQYGVDIEPNFNTEYLEDITFLRTITRMSASRGFGMFFNAMIGTSNPVSIRLIDCTDIGSLMGFNIESARNIPGRIDIIRPVSRNALEMGVEVRRKAVTGPFVHIEKPVVIDWNRSETGVTIAAAAVAVHAPGGTSGTEALGGVDIVDPEIVLSSGPASSAVHIQDQRTTTPDPMADIRIIDPLDLSGLRCWITGDNNTLSDKNRISLRTLDDASQAVGSASTFFHNLINITGTRNYTLSAFFPVGTELVFEMMSEGSSARIVFPTGQALFPDTLGGNMWITSSTKGSRLKIRKTAADEWMVIEKVGTWATE